MRQVRHIIQIFLDIERPDPNVILPRKWVENRIKFFSQFTLRSLMNQTTQAFEIFLICGRRHKDLTSSIPWNKRVTVVYPDGDPTIGATLTQSPTIPDKKPTTWIKEYMETKQEYLAITRIDSDDLMHRGAMAEIRSLAQSCLLGPVRTRFLHATFWKWHILDRILEQQHKENPPFYTHIFPKEIAQDWRRFGKLHFNNHRFLGGKATPHILSPNMICVCSHQENISRIKRGRSLKYMRSCERDLLIKKNPGSTRDRREMVQFLSPFNIRARDI